MKFENWSTKAEPSRIEEWSCREHQTLVRVVDRNGEIEIFVSGCVCFQLTNIPLLPNSSDKKPERIGNIRI